MKLPVNAILSVDGIIYLKGIDLEDSFLLGLHFNEDQSELCIDLEFSIWPESQYYQPPKPNEWTCYRRGQLIFNGVKQINGFSNLKDLESSIDPDGEKDWGNIHGLRMCNEQVKLATEQIEIVLVADRLEIIIVDAIQ